MDYYYEFLAPLSARLVRRSGKKSCKMLSGLTTWVCSFKSSAHIEPRHGELQFGRMAVGRIGSLIQWADDSVGSEKAKYQTPGTCFL